MPVLCSFVLRGKIHEGDNRAMRFLKNLYRPVLEWALRFRWLMVGGAP
jgi:cobalt-zinc-cadmium resistance protein CzcA